MNTVNDQRNGERSRMTAVGKRTDDGSKCTLLVVGKAQWALDEAAHDFPAGRVGAARREELAGTLEGLAAIVRASAPEGAR